MFGKDKEKIREKDWNWENFESTKDYPVSENLLEWVIGQDEALEECYLCLDEWVHKLRWIQSEDWYGAWKDPETEKPSAKKSIPAGPYLLLLGDAGTGKSLIGRALASHLTELYKKHNIKLRDVICWANKIIPSEPRISIVKAGEGKKIVQREKIRAEKKKRWFKWGFRLLQGLMIGFGIAIIGLVLGFIAWNWISNPEITYYSTKLQEMITTGTRKFFNDNFINYFLNQLMGYAQMLYLGIGALSMGAMIFIFKNILGRGLIGGSAKGIGGAESTEAPKLIVDNSEKVAPFMDATGHKSAQLFGSIAWDPLQTGGLGTPEHQRTTAGDVHKANLGILYIDEIKNLHPEEAVTLLTVLEEGQLPITLRSRWAAGGTSAMAVSTEPVPCLTFLVGAGNFDSIGQIHPALMDRIYGYGKVVRMNNDMPNTLENRRKYIQFIAQEVNRFHLIPFSRGACEEIVSEGRRRSGKRDRLTTKFRPLISIIKTSATLAMNDKKGIVEKKYVEEAISEHCKTIQKQLLEHEMEERGKLLEIKPEGTKVGSIYGLAVVADEYSGEMTGTVLPVNGFIEKRKKIEKKVRETVKGFFAVTGVAKAEQAEWIDDSIAKVRTVILQKYGADIAQHYITHIDFSQSHGIDGPSAGVTMTLLLCSLIEGKPIRQDVAVTGEINIGVGDEIKVTAVGGVHEKIRAAEAWGFKKVVIPMKNLKYSVNPNDYNLEVVGAETLDDYLRECLIQ